jgi:thiamine-monophosphate kinase
MKRLTEREIINELIGRIPKQAGVPLGFDDDVSAIPLSPRRWVIAKTDMLVGSTDIPPGMDLREAARKAIVATVSDFAAKGVQPRSLMTSLGLPTPVNKETVQQIADGFNQATREYKVKIIGGDTNQSRDTVIDVIGIGVADPKKIVRRDGAQPGDIVAVTGQFGKTTPGLRILLSRSKSDRVKFRSLVRSVLHPVARLKEGIELARSGAITSSIDSSDGLAWSLHEIANASHVGIHIEKIPIDNSARIYAAERRTSDIELALYGGEEYELVTTIKPKQFSRLKRRFPYLRQVGGVTSDKGVTAKINGRRARVRNFGWEHFSRN